MLTRTLQRRDRRPGLRTKHLEMRYPAAIDSLGRASPDVCDGSADALGRGNSLRPPDCRQRNSREALLIAALIDAGTVTKRYRAIGRATPENQQACGLVFEHCGRRDLVWIFCRFRHGRRRVCMPFSARMSRYRPAQSRLQQRNGKDQTTKAV